jgi:hypothetical protein
MKKHYDVNLDEVETEELKKLLQARSMSLSGFLTSVIHEHMEAMKRFKVPSDVSKVTLGEFMRMAVDMMTDLKREVKADRGKSPEQ